LVNPFASITATASSCLGAERAEVSWRDHRCREPITSGTRSVLTGSTLSRQAMYPYLIEDPDDTAFHASVGRHRRPRRGRVGRCTQRLRLVGHDWGRSPGGPQRDEYCAGAGGGLVSGIDGSDRADSARIG
jgi:hypothetical protein